MNFKTWRFFKWTRDNQKAFADAVAAELESKASKEIVDKLSAEVMRKSGDIMLDYFTIKIPPKYSTSEYPIRFTTQYREDSLLHTWYIGASCLTGILYFAYNKSDLVGLSQSMGIFPLKTSLSLGHSKYPWKNTFTKKINNGADIEIPNKAGTMALVSDIEDILRKHGLIPTETTNNPQDEKQA